MKLTKLLVLSALWLIGLSASAADLIERTAPTVADVTPTPVAFEANHQYLLYNTGAQMFFSQGNAWGTRASGHADQSQALRVKFVEYVPEGDVTLEEATYIFKINSSVRNTNYSWHECFFDNESAMFVDRGSQANYYWAIDNMGNNVYRLKAAKANPSLQSDGTTFVGRNDQVEQDASNLSDVYDNANAYPLSPFLTAEGEGSELNHVDWVFYDASIFDAYEQSVALKAAIEKAEAAGLDVSAAVAVYNNLQSTAAELKAAIDALEAALSDNVANATGQKPQDASSWIVNGSFDTLGDFTGWSGSSFGIGGTTSTCAERYNMTYDTYQDITVKYPGLYLFGVKGFYRAGSSDNSFKLFNENNPDARLATFYVTIGEGRSESLQISSIWDGAQAEKPAHGKAMASNGLWIPNTMADADEFFHTDGLYGHLLPVEIEGTDVTVRIGVKKDTKISDNDWSIFDDFTLTFCGAGDDRYVGYAKTAAAAYPSYENAVATKSYLEAYNAIRNNPTGTDKASVEAYIASLDAAKAILVENISLWGKWESLVKTAQDIIELYSKDEDMAEEDVYWDLIAYADGTDPDAVIMGIRESRNMTNEELSEEIAKLEKLIADVENTAKNRIKEGDDVTKFLTNPDFENGTNGWTIVSKGGGNVQLGGNNANHCYEAWHSTNFDIYQEVADAPVGVYEISVKGYVRYLDGDEAIKARGNQPDEIPIYVYLNDVKNQFVNWFSYPRPLGYYKEIDSGSTVKADEDAGEEFPDNMTAASIAFNEGGYVNKASGLLANKGDVLRIGVKGTPEAHFWPIWDDFKLIYKGFDITVVKPELEKAIANAEPLLDKVFASDLKAQLRTALEEAKAALELTDGKAMFKKLAALVAIDVDASIKKFEDFQQALVDFETAYANADAAGEDSRPSQATLDEALALVGRAQTIVDSEDFTDAELDELLAEMEAMTKKLGIPAAMDTAADETPANATYMITNPTYTDNSTSGWTRENATGNYGAEYTVCENYNGKFDIFQDLEDMYEGTYELSVQVFYRNGSAVNDYKTFIEDATANNNAYIYVGIGDGKITAKAPRLASIAKSFTSTSKDDNGNFKSEDNYAWVVEQADLEVDADSTMATGLQVPNMRIVVNSFFEDEVANGTSALKASIIFKVGADGKARIGVAKSEEVGNDWTAWDNWKLTYYGKNSSKEPGVIDGVKDASTVADVVKTEVFTLSGARVKSGKGVAIMRQTLSNGTVRVKKVMVK